MNYQIRPFEESDLNDVVALSVVAWEPVFVAWEKILGPELYPIAIYPDWRIGQADCCQAGLQRREEPNLGRRCGRTGRWLCRLRPESGKPDR